MRMVLMWVCAALAVIPAIPPPVSAQHDGVMVTQENLQALLAFKQALVDPHGALASWNGSSGEGACSGAWAGLKCSHGQVICVQLSGKGLGGVISERIGQLSLLRKLNLHTNRIGGSIPFSLGGLSKLRGLYLFGNQLTGAIPVGIGSSPALQAVDLSRNQLVGSIPSGIAASRKLLLLDLSFNNLTGVMPTAMAANPSLTLLAVAHNRLTGALPGAWGATGTSHLRYLFASSNNLSGSLPPSLAKLAALRALDLSRNAFTGSIPAALLQLANLTAFNVSYNRLSVAIPSFRSRFNASSFTGNAGLCGWDGLPLCPPSQSPSPSSAPLPAGNNPQRSMRRQRGRRIVRISILVLILILLGSSLCVGCAIALLVFKLRRTHHLPYQPALDKQITPIPAKKHKLDQPEIAGKLLHFDQTEGAFTADELLCATAEVMGKSSYGTVYKASLGRGVTVVVKRLREGNLRSEKEFESEMNLLGSIRHPNLVAIRAYYWGPKDEKLLVFECLPGGSLAAFLHARGPETPFGWTARMKIAVDAARGLNHLHVHERIIHGNLSSRNILLDSNLTAKISDFGFARLMTASAHSNAIATAGAQGYRAPELTNPKKATTKSDVYSFGIVLLELLTGKPPGEPISSLDLQEWISSSMNEGWSSEILDVELMKGSAAPPSQEEMLETLQLALSCISSNPGARPDMVDVMHQLEEAACEIPHQNSSMEPD